MPFKIVRTIEKGKPQLCIVPSQWESGGTVKWPKRGAAKLSQNQDTIPGSDWLEINCSVKRRNIVSYEVADAELQAMLDNTDTEKEDDEQMTFRRSVQHREPANLNFLAEQLVLQEDCGNTSTAKIDARNASESQPGETYIILSDNSGTQAATIQEPNCDIQNILQNQSILFDITNQIIENQRKIIHKLASISVQMEESFSKIENLNTKTVSLRDASSAETDSFILKQIKNVKDLEQMEQLLSDKEYKKKLKNSCLFICSSGEGHGTNCAYRFLDVLFSRDFLCECSWLGSCRDDYVKISLKCFKNTLNFFFEMINHWDTSYTQETNETFFKNILKNAKKRNSVKYERMPTKRNRLKGVKSAKKQKTTDTSNIIEGIGTETINIPVIDDQPANDTTEGSANIERVRDNGEEEEDYLC